MHKSNYGGAKGDRRKKMVAKAKEAHKEEKEDKRPDWLKKLKPLKKGKSDA